MSAISRTVTLPVNAGAAWDTFTWGTKSSADALDYSVDAQAWIAESGHVLGGVAMYASPDITVSNIAYILTGNAMSGVTIRIAGGTPGGSPVVRLLLSLGDALGTGGVVEVVVSLHVRVAPPTGLVLVAAPTIPTGALLDDSGRVLADDTATVLIPA